MTRSVESLSRGAGAMSLPYEWSRSANVRFVGEPPYPNASHVTVKEIGMPSGSYQGDYVTVSKLCPAEMRTFTIVQVDVSAGLSEEEEESPGLFLCLSNVVPVTLSIRPANLPSDQLLTLTGVENCYEDPEKHTPAASSYPVSQFLSPCTWKASPPVLVRSPPPTPPAAPKTGSDTPPSRPR